MYQTPGFAPDRGSIQTSAIILIIVGFLCGGMIPAIFGIIALAQLDSNPHSARQMNKVGWIIAVILIALSLLALLASVLIPVIFGVAVVPFLFAV